MRPWIRRLAVGAFVINVLAVTWPVLTYFRAPEPLILGLPLSMAWPIGWILVGWWVLLLVDHVESREDPN